ncbi:MAG: methionyl-tRNA formyltransferase [Syntrophorhabdaceae bacterium]|nr:methionyl-tRNA formyltransferase [Syntrophorhabdaceae bacterium]MDD4195293.1 methionyl-tRNA formyltransferase [Syntrophorhabdaceae bacterium]HOC45336.1 methionyl-tRNA formyltransferase [Syntrophorhabdaceae bacterium]
MRIVFFGSSIFSVPSLLKVRGSVAAVVTKKARPKGRGYQIDDNEVKRRALELGLPLIEINSFKDEEARSIADYAPDLFVVISFGLIVPKWALDIPSIGPVNIHPSLLPLYRGPSPMQWALLNCDTATGITFIRMNEKMDEGDIIFQERVAIGDSEDYTSLSNRLAQRSADILYGVIERIEKERVIEGEAQDHSKATYSSIITKEMGRIDWSSSARQIHCRIRAFVEWPTAYTFLEGKRLKIYHAMTDEAASSGQSPGTIVAVTRSGIDVATGKGLLTITELQLENKKRMKAYDFSRGYRDLRGNMLN